jgi:site-specific DNA recombinase
MLNQAIFHGLYIDDDQITDHNLREPCTQLHAVQSDR